MTKEQDERLIAALERIATALENRPPVIVNPPSDLSAGPITMISAAPPPNAPVQAVAPHKNRSKP
jgi:hypothetical protein